MKYIIAQKNDTVEISATQGVMVNGRVILHSIALNEYNGIYLHPLQPQKVKLRLHEFFVLGLSSHSYDSRYFGIINTNQIYRKALFLYPD